MFIFGISLNADVFTPVDDADRPVCIGVGNDGRQRNLQVLRGFDGVYVLGLLVLVWRLLPRNRFLIEARSRMDTLLAGFSRLAASRASDRNCRLK